MEFYSTIRKNDTMEAWHNEWCNWRTSC
jgi:hypothetical protein